MSHARKQDASTDDESGDRPIVVLDGSSTQGEGETKSDPRTVAELVEETSVELSEGTETRRAILRAAQTRFLSARLAGRRAMSDAGSFEWTDASVASLCGALALLLERIVMDASRAPEWALVRLVAANGSSHISVVPLPGSRMDAARGDRNRDEAVRIDPTEIAMWLGNACALTREQALSAWTSLAPLLVEAEDCLPGVRLRRDPGRSSLLISLEDGEDLA